MVKKGKHFLGKVTPLFATMLVQPTHDEGTFSERPSEAQPTPSPAPTSEATSLVQASQLTLSKVLLLTTTIPDSYSTEIFWWEYWRFFRSSQRKYNDLKASDNQSSRSKLNMSLNTIKHGESSVQRDPLFDEIPEDTVDHMETENAQNEGRTKEMVDEDKEMIEYILVMRELEGTVENLKDYFESTLKVMKSKTNKITPKQKASNSPYVFESMMGIRKFLEEKEKGVELKGCEERTDRPMPTSTKFTFSLKAFPKIDQKTTERRKLKRGWNLKGHMMVY
ncbi:hypothetical protein Tco_1379748 [Tanacetum coccineum]